MAVVRRTVAGRGVLQMLLILDVAEDAVAVGGDRAEVRLTQGIDGALQQADTVGAEGEHPEPGVLCDIRHQDRQRRILGRHRALGNLAFWLEDFFGIEVACRARRVPLQLVSL